MLPMSHNDTDARLREYIRDLQALLGQTMTVRKAKAFSTSSRDVCYLVRTGPAAAARTLADVDLPCVVPLQQLQVTINGIATGLRSTG